MLRKYVYKLSPTQIIVSAYFTAIVIITGLLMLPISVKPGVNLSLIDALFTAASAVSVTGLTTVSTADTFSTFGSFVLMLAFQIGGIGVMTLGTFFWILFGAPIGLSQRRLIMIDQNRYNLSGLVQLMKLVLGMTLLFEAVGTLIFGLYFYFAGYYDTFYASFYYAVFHSISTYTNAGFDLFGNSLIDYSHDYFVQSVTMLLIILGAIGFPVLVEVREYLFGGHNRFRFSLYTKITTVTFLVLLVLGMLVIWITEDSRYFAEMSWYEKFFHSLFLSVTARSAGLTTVDVSELSVGSQFVTSILMFIGASPSSVGGGIRTTTLAVVILMIVTFARGRSEVRVFGRSIRQEDIIKSFVFFVTALMLVTGGTLVVHMLEDQRFELVHVIFEVCSAFGTCGLSVGITSGLSYSSKIILVLLMYIGRIGMMPFLSSFTSGKSTADVHYPKEKIIIG
ncbi:potassium transporter TrkG [Aneurinibacillus thermoaerophilus]|uniref:Potassium uptake protein, TrkH family n=1 Tax=Aneurinibacillus thermoaerophilus TaxID=143495 RepID=A0A1G8C9L0_ANETH|nr:MULTISPECIES: potassium transporter TrkG [Aneurinibacillus]AMA71550.1 ATP synthase [Aneurinibacillus sp. XH2]MED0681177.1 potassium transporter TrkG [Aneurinibacillus thermoaerophilus]MED0757333.1 potassium transporter TrkG [Aneurinibacillus thermoaerophilus]MED0761464.1 potassium transporter TrkG [Aneurinibacillus thermoaerophilus]MED0765133.1 potassium transporter TrkG [Aneurinibacillus thermoaerophilus]